VRDARVSRLSLPGGLRGPRLRVSVSELKKKLDESSL
jgi:hypothetical protein